MRHFLRRILGQPSARLSCSVLASPFARALVGGTGTAYRLSTADRPAVAGAVNLAVIARWADANLVAAARADEDPEADGRLLGPLGMSGRWQRTCPAHATGGSCGEDAMAKIGRNEPCPCGSGSKYKRCCLGAPVATELTATNAPAPAEPHQELCPCCVDELNERADHVLDELLAGRTDEAEALCQAFLRDFPGEAEGIDLLSMICEERGQRDRALDLLRQASRIAHANPDYDAETRSLMRERISELELPA